jgi:cytochrome c2
MRKSWRQLATVSLLGFLLLSLAGCDLNRPDYRRLAKTMTGGDPLAGRDKIQMYGCPACHTIPGIPQAKALVGPPLIHWARRAYIAGELPNTPDNLMRWIQHPPQVEPKTAMPDMGVTEKDSRDIAAYLYSIW